MEIMENNLMSLRKEVDKLDYDLIKLFRKRFELAIKIWKIKKPLGMKIKNPKREKEIIESIVKKSGFDKNFVNKLYNNIFEESRRIQNKSVK
jgi:chorismate mutase